MGINKHTFESIDKEIRAVKARLADTIKEYRSAVKATTRFLSACHKVGIKLVSIETKTNRIKETTVRVFGVKGCVFATGHEKREDGSEGWPSIWKASKIAGIDDGCGGTDWHSIKQEIKLVEGVYEFRNGSWRMIQP